MTKKEPIIKDVILYVGVLAIAFHLSIIEYILGWLSPVGLLLNLFGFLVLLGMYLNNERIDNFIYKRKKQRENNG